MQLSEGREGIRRDDDVADFESAAGNPKGQLSLIAREIGARDVPRCAGNERTVGRANEEESPFDARPEEQRVEHLIEKRREAIARTKRANEAFENRDLRGLESTRRRADR